MSRSRIVQPAKQDGRIVSLRFYRTYGVGNSQRDVLIRIHRDGHLTASKPTEPDFMDLVVSSLNRIHEHKDYWKTLNSQIDEFVTDLMIRDLIKGVKNYKSKKHQATGANVTEFVEQDDYQRVEVQVYEALLFNIGIELIKSQQNGNIPPSSSTHSNPEEQNGLKGLFDNYAECELTNPNYDFNQLWNHLHSLLSSDYSSSVELIETTVDRYDL